MQQARAAKAPESDIQPLAPALGAEVRGIDLRRPIAADERRRLRAALARHKVLFFRDQFIDTGEFVRLARVFGEPEPFTFVPGVPGHPEAMRVRHDRDNRSRENVWHSDKSWAASPTACVLLRAIELPARGGDTLFANLVAIFDSLAEEAKQRLRHLGAVHDLTPYYVDWYPRRMLAKVRRENPPREHPMVRRHPVTGEELVFVNPLFTTHIPQLDAAGSAALLREIFARIERPEFQCRLEWRPGSVALFDNLACVHLAVDDYWPETRIMERILIAGGPPSGGISPTAPGKGKC